MTRNLLISSLFCTAFTLAGCGDDGNKASNSDPTNAANPTATETNGASETGAAASTSGVDTNQPTTAGPSSDPTSATDPSAGTTEAGGTFIIPTDMPMGGGTIECDVFAQDCKGADEKCTAWAEGGGGAWNATKCVKETGKKIAGDVCTTEGGGVSGMDDCAKGNMCWNVNDKNEGICVALCKGDAKAPICPAEFQCAIANEGVLNLCLPECDPLLQDCDGTDLCIPSGDKFICVLDASGDNGKQNDPCMFANACDKGLICLNTTAASTDCMKAATGCCSPFCDFAKQDTICPKGTECVQWFDPMMPIPPGLEDVGVCAIPA